MGRIMGGNEGKRSKVQTDQTKTPNNRPRQIAHNTQQAAVTCRTPQKGERQTLHVPARRCKIARERDTHTHTHTQTNRKRVPEREAKAP
ncbi:hypothetical protein LY78DRAFT_663616 [Colletotrichum sublineola]|nr:hypothetical protein LY78DRAFT_663616 [Colletotrichum sublineola]